MGLIDLWPGRTEAQEGSEKILSPRAQIFPVIICLWKTFLENLETFITANTFIFFSSALTYCPLSDRTDQVVIAFNLYSLGLQNISRIGKYFISNYTINNVFHKGPSTVNILYWQVDRRGSVICL